MDDPWDGYVPSHFVTQLEQLIERIKPVDAPPQVDGIAYFNSKYGYYELSNFYEHPLSLVIGGAEYRFRNAEAAYQAVKQIDRSVPFIMPFTRLTANEAKQAGKSVSLRPDWEQVKVSAMMHILKAKFSHPHMYELLQATHPLTLIHWCPWGDTFWGVGRDRRGQNQLGALLSVLRDAGPARSDSSRAS